jgi:hypothetical protein
LPPEDGNLFPIAAAFWATDGGNAGANAGCTALGAVEPGGVTGACSCKVVVFPAGSVIVTIFVALLITTLLWTFAKITLFGGGAMKAGGSHQIGTGT